MTAQEPSDVSSGVFNANSVVFLISSLVIAGALLKFSQYNYLLFHGIAEIYSVAIAFAVFVISWNVRQKIENILLVYIGIAYLFIGIIDLFHMFSYVGMNIFTDYDYYANQLWIGARYLEALSLLFFYLLTGKKNRFSPLSVFSAYALVATLLLLSVFTWKIFPICFVEGEGLTRFKIISEYIICLILLFTLVLQYKKKAHFDRVVRHLLTGAIILTIIGELAFTFYISNYGFSNLIGHFMKIGSFYLVYKALIVTGLNRPFDLLLRDLKENERQLKENGQQLMASNDTLQKEITERKQAEEKIRANLKEKEMLLQEIHHRVKNNMGIVSGLLGLQMMQTSNEETKGALVESMNRVQAISLIHETIYQAEDLATIQLRDYLDHLAKVIADGLKISPEIMVSVDAENITINARQASPIGIITNEMITNALKYAFPEGKAGNVLISVKNLGDRMVELVIGDDGIGLPSDFNLGATSSLGLKLVSQIVESQLRGEFLVESEKGSRFITRFELEDV